MPTIKARVGSQNVVRVLSNASSPATRLINLDDVNKTYRAIDGMILVWDLPTESFIMTSRIDSSLTTIEGIAYFTNTEDSTSTTTGALIVSGGVGIAKNLNVGGNLEITGISTFSSDVDINAAVNILNNLVVSGTTQVSGLTSFTDTTQNTLGNVNTGSVQFDGGIGVEKNLTVGGGVYVGEKSEFIGVATFRSAIDGDGGADISGGETTLSSATVSDLTNNRIVISGPGGSLEDNVNLAYDGSDLIVNSARITDLTSGRVLLAGSSGSVQDSSDLTFDGSNLSVNGSVNVDNVRIDGNEIDTSSGGLTLDSASGTITVDDNLTVVGDLTVNGTQTVINTEILEVEDINIGIASAVPKLNNSQLDGAGITIHGLDGDKTLSWDNSNSRLAFNTDVYAPNYYAGTYDGPNGVAYFDDSGKLVGAASTESLLSTSYYILTIEQSSGVPKWTSTIDGGEY